MSKQQDPALSDEEYIKDGGMKCPYCLSDRIDAGRLDQDVRHVVQAVGCDNCGAEWDDIYTLTGFERVHGPDESKER